MVLKLVVDILTVEFCGGMYQDKIVDGVFTVSVLSMVVVVFYEKLEQNEKEQEHKLEHGMQSKCGYYWSWWP